LLIIYFHSNVRGSDCAVLQLSFFPVWWCILLMHFSPASNLHLMLRSVCIMLHVCIFILVDDTFHFMCHFPFFFFYLIHHTIRNRLASSTNYLEENAVYTQ
jgi:hypothetical protein